MNSFDFFTDEADDEQVQAFNAVEQLINKFKLDNNRLPTKLFVSDGDEDQSYKLWAGGYYGLQIARTFKKKTYVE